MRRPSRCDSRNEDQSTNDVPPDPRSHGHLPGETVSTVGGDGAGAFAPEEDAPSKSRAVGDGGIEDRRG